MVVIDESLEIGHISEDQAVEHTHAVDPAWLPDGSSEARTGPGSSCAIHNGNAHATPRTLGCDGTRQGPRWQWDPRADLDFPRVARTHDPAGPSPRSPRKRAPG